MIMDYEKILNTLTKCGFKPYLQELENDISTATKGKNLEIKFQLVSQGNSQSNKAVWLIQMLQA